MNKAVTFALRNRGIVVVLRKVCKRVKKSISGKLRQILTETGATNFLQKYLQITKEFLSLQSQTGQDMESLKHPH